MSRHIIAACLMALTEVGCALGLSSMHGLLFEQGVLPLFGGAVSGRVVWVGVLAPAGFFLAAWVATMLLPGRYLPQGARSLPVAVVTCAAVSLLYALLAVPA